MFQPNRIGTLFVLGVCLTSTITVVGPAAANELENKLEEIQQDLDQSREKRADLDWAAQKAGAELQTIKRRGVSLARKMHRHSANADRIKAKLIALKNQERAKSDKIRQRKTQLAATLAALQRLSLMPTATLVAIPQSTNKTIRTAILLRAAVPQLQQDAITLGNDLRTLTSLRNRINADKTALSIARARLKEKREALAALTIDKTGLLQTMKIAERMAAHKTARLLARAGSLRELLESLSNQRRRPALSRPDLEPLPGIWTAIRNKAAIAPIAPGTRLRGALPAPGRVMTSFGQKMPNGTLSKGVFVVTRPAAVVVAPLMGRIVFAGQFRGYGNLVILELSDRGHGLISGMSRIDAQIGDEVLAGEPLGEMTSSTSTTPKLYFELRRRGLPINPMPSDLARRNKVSG